MDFLKLIIDGIAYFFKNLPQYAAILTSLVAITLFIIKERRENKKKIADEVKSAKKLKEEVEAIKIVLGAEAFAIFSQIGFFLDLSEKLKDSVRVKLEVMPDNLWRQLHIGYDQDNGAYSQFVMIPNSPTMFDHAFITNAIKLNKDIFDLINMLNQAAIAMCKGVDSCIGSAIDNDVSRTRCIVSLMVDGNPASGRNIVKNILKGIHPLQKEMSTFGGYSKLSKKINNQYGSNFS
ncbi:MAG: hypothetical protein PV362_01215 [Providencia heimbachae]|nr:hypothetical protein [Providencia heimbachae]